MSRRKNEEESFFYDLLHKLGGSVGVLEHLEFKKDLFSYERNEETECVHLSRLYRTFLILLIKSSTGWRSVSISQTPRFYDRGPLVLDTIGQMANS